jgi:hypothetical protein
LNPNILTTCARDKSKRFLKKILNDDLDMSNEDVEDQDLEELSNKDEIAKKKRPSVLCLKVLCYFMVVIF